MRRRPLQTRTLYRLPKVIGMVAAVMEIDERIARFRDRLADRIANGFGLDPASPVAAAVFAAAVAALEDVEAERASRPRCAVCGEPIVLADPNDPESWVHAEDAADWGDHTAEIGTDRSGDGGSVLGEGVAGERLS